MVGGIFLSIISYALTNFKDDINLIIKFLITVLASALK